MCSTNVSAGRAVPADMMKELERRPAARKPVKSSRQQDAAWGYAKVAFLMFIALFIVWVPSTVNRVYSLVHPDESNFALSLVAAAVLPLQGFWNFCIYILTSWHQARDVWRRMTKEVRRFFRRQLRRSNSTATPARPGARGIRLDSVATTATPAGVASAGTHGSATSAAAGERQGVHQRSGSLSSNSTLQDVDISSMSKQVRLESSKDSMRTPGAMSAASGRR